MATIPTGLPRRASIGRRSSRFFSTPGYDARYTGAAKTMARAVEIARTVARVTVPYASSERPSQISTGVVARSTSVTTASGRPLRARSSRVRAASASRPGRVAAPITTARSAVTSGALSPLAQRPALPLVASRLSARRRRRAADAPRQRSGRLAVAQDDGAVDDRRRIALGAADDPGRAARQVTDLLAPTGAHAGGIEDDEIGGQALAHQPAGS